jgi:hypothetical protein
MKRLILLTLVLSLTAGTAAATEYGLRAGLSIDPDQFHFGGHADLGPVIETWRFVPNIEIGLGNDVTLIALNGDLIYDFPESRWSVGGELGINIANYDVPNIPGVDIDDSSTDIGLSALGNYRLTLNSGKVLVLEAKLGLLDSPDVKFTLGWNF